MIEFHDVHKSFGSLDVLKGINLKIEKSQVVTLIGPSGSGKSTILRCMNLLERPTSGQVLIEGTGHYGTEDRHSEDPQGYRHGVPAFQSVSAYDSHGKHGLCADPGQ